MLDNQKAAVTTKLFKEAKQEVLVNSNHQNNVHSASMTKTVQEE